MNNINTSYLISEAFDRLNRDIVWDELKKVQKWKFSRFVQMIGIFNRIKDAWQREPDLQEKFPEYAESIYYDHGEKVNEFHKCSLYKS
jgi:hypothetical protein